MITNCKVKMIALDIQNLKKTYPNGVEALKGISLSVNQGDFFALLGANGAGKSTTIGLITSLITKTEGNISLFGHDAFLNPAKAKMFLGVVPQEFNLNIFETCEHILYNQAGYYGLTRHAAKPQIDYLLDKLGLEEKRHHIVRQLSGGMKRRLMIARALVHKPQLLILDEPTAGVDVEIRRSMWDFLQTTNKSGTTIILTTHYLEEAELLCKNIAIIDKGIIIRQQSMSELLKTLNHQTFVINSHLPISALPDLSPYETLMIDEHSFEIRVSDKVSLNELFERLSHENIQVSSLRNKTNRLEELFMELINHAN